MTNTLLVRPLFDRIKFERKTIKGQDRTHCICKPIKHLYVLETKKGRSSNINIMLGGYNVLLLRVDTTVIRMFTVFARDFVVGRVAGSPFRFSFRSLSPQFRSRLDPSNARSSRLSEYRENSPVANNLDTRLVRRSCARSRRSTRSEEIQGNRQGNSTCYTFNWHVGIEFALMEVGRRLKIYTVCTYVCTYLQGIKAYVTGK